jgi:nitrogen fixation/metabolism regulation signal transduction histidine kinase
MKVWRVIELNHGYLLEITTLEKGVDGQVGQTVSMQAALRNEDEVIRTVGTMFTLIKRQRDADRAASEAAMQKAEAESVAAQVAGDIADVEAINDDILDDTTTSKKRRSKSTKE